jgi:hypothetical protein
MSNGTVRSLLEETVSQLQNSITNLKAKIDLIDMRLEEQEQYSRRTSLRFHNVRVPTDDFRVLPFLY